MVSPEREAAMTSLRLISQEAQRENRKNKGNINYELNLNAVYQDTYGYISKPNALNLHQKEAITCTQRHSKHFVIILTTARIFT